MKLRRFLLNTVLFGSLFFTPNEIKVERLEKIPLIEIEKLNVLDFQHIKGISYWYNDTNSYDIITKLMANHGIIDMLKDFKSDKQDTLINNVRYYSYVRSPTDEHYRSEVYPEFIELNKRLQQDKSKLGEYELLRMDNTDYFVSNGYAYELSNDKTIILDKYRTYLDHLGSLIKTYPESDYNNTTATTFLNLTEYLPLIKTLNQGINLDEKTILALIASESLGYDYIAGISGDVNIFQLSLDTIKKLYSRLKRSDLQEDFLYKNILQINTISLENFEESILISPNNNITLGMYLLKELNKIAKSEAQLILLYKMGNDNFSHINWNLQGRILNNEYTSSSHITEKDKERKYMRGLYHYFKKKEHFVMLGNALTN